MEYELRITLVISMYFDGLCASSFVQSISLFTEYTNTWIRHSLYHFETMQKPWFF